MRRSLPAAVLLVAVTVLGACSADADDDAGDADPGRGGAESGPSIGRYVAIGDSFAAGSGLPEPVPENPGACQQSYLNYPHLVAEELGAELADVTCAGASTDHVTQQQGGPVAARPPQLDAVTPDTDLVTVALGYNDFAMYVGALRGDAALAPVPAVIGTRVQAVLEQVQAAAPEAEVLFVGYPQPVPEADVCPDRKLTPGDREVTRTLLISLDGALRAAAEAAGVRYVDVMAASEGHDICAGDEAWVAGRDPEPGTAVGYHPYALWHEDVAELVLEALEG